MTITITADEPRSIKAIQIAADAAQWLRCHTRDGRKAYGVPSQCQPGRYYLVDLERCDCPDFQRNGLSGSRIGHAGVHAPCKHILAVRLHCEQAKAQQARPARRARRATTVAEGSTQRSRLSVVPAGDVFDRFVGD